MEIREEPRESQTVAEARGAYDYARGSYVKLSYVNICRELGNYECEGDGVGVETTALRA